ncbi:MAG TPA: hypothetical protein VEZ17_04445, partial [Chitinophagaceae bacterium]|nr:hypothetical protein [Chitinophagaceae bacterium]
MTNSIYSRVIYCFFLSIVFTQGFSQNFYNLDLEYSKPSGYPYTWQTNEGNPASKISVTNSISYSGKNSLQFKIDNSPMSLAGILFSNDMLSGKAVEISGYINTDSLQKG